MSCEKSTSLIIGNLRIQRGRKTSFRNILRPAYSKGKSMKLSIKTLRTVAMIGFLAASSASFAAKGFSITQAEEKLVKVDMTADEVRSVIGRPSHTHKYRSSTGPTWVYTVNFAPVAETTFQIDFNSSGRVQSFGEVVPARQGQEGYLAQ